MFAAAPVAQAVWWTDYVNIALSAIACVINLWAARSAFLDAKPRLYCTAFLAGFWCAAYSILVFSGITAAHWAMYVRPVGSLGWIVVWIWPAWNVARLVRRSNEALTSREGYPDDW